MSTDSTAPTTPMTTLTLTEVRAILSDEIHRLRSGESTPATANSVTNAVGKILSSVKLEMEYLRLTGRKVTIPLLDQPADEAAA